MTSRKPLRMLFSLSLFLILAVPFVTATQPASTAARDRVEVASCQRCGDGYCAPSCENERTCPADCRSTKAPAVAPATPAPATPAAKSTRCGRCGDGQCVKSCGETTLTCPIDCGGGPGEPSKASTSPAKPETCASEK